MSPGAASHNTVVEHWHILLEHVPALEVLTAVAEIALRTVEGGQLEVRFVESPGIRESECLLQCLQVSFIKYGFGG